MGIFIALVAVTLFTLIAVPVTRKVAEARKEHLRALAYNDHVRFLEHKLSNRINF